METGVVYTYTVIRSTSETFKDKTPYVMAVIDRGDSKVLARIEGYQEGQAISIGMKVPFLKNDETGNPIYRF